jgi:hypothetical protein
MLDAREARMLKDGLYELFYRPEATPEAAYDSLLLSLRNGKVLGSDRWGGVFLGRCLFDTATRLHKICVRLQVPPGGMLVTDNTPRDSGDVIEIVTAFDDNPRDGTGVVEVGGHLVRIALQFMGPVPA